MKELVKKDNGDGISLKNELRKNEYIQSPNSNHRLVMKSDCNLVLFVCICLFYACLREQFLTIN